MKDIWLLIGFAAVWFFLQAWFLPRMGVST
jgi:hypothetical protein